jgi:hypothetical protein
MKTTWPARSASARAACRLDTLGFDHAFDDMPGRADWLAGGLPPGCAPGTS